MRNRVLALAGLLVAAACEPSTVTEARDRLRGDAVDTTVLRVPLADDVFAFDDLGLTRDTTLDDLAAARVNTDSGDILVIGGADFETAVEFERADLNLGDFEDVVRDAFVNRVDITLDFRHAIQQDVELTGAQLGVVELTATGTVPRDPVTNEPEFEVDGAGNPILVPITDPGVPTLTLPAAPPGGTSSKQLTVAADTLIDRLVDLVLDGRRAAILAEGSTTTGPGLPGETVRILFDLVLGLDLTLPDTGVVFDRTEVQDGLDVSAGDADQIAERLIRTVLTGEVLDGTPFGLEVELAYVTGDQTGVDVFALPGAVLLPAVSTDGPPVDATGRVTQAITDTISLAVSGSDVRPLLDSLFTAGLRLRLVPRSSTERRGAIRVTDSVVVRSRLRLEIQRGGGS